MILSFFRSRVSQEDWNDTVGDWSPVMSQMDSHQNALFIKSNQM